MLQLMLRDIYSRRIVHIMYQSRVLDAQDSSTRILRRQVLILQDACRDANTAARNALGIEPLPLPDDQEAGAESPFKQAHSDQLGSLVDLMTSKLKVCLQSSSMPCLLPSTPRPFPPHGPPMKIC